MSLFPHSHLIKIKEGLTAIIFTIMETANTVFSLPLMDRVQDLQECSYLFRALPCFRGGCASHKHVFTF